MPPITAMYIPYARICFSSCVFASGAPGQFASRLKCALPLHSVSTTGVPSPSPRLIRLSPLRNCCTWASNDAPLGGTWFTSIRDAAFRRSFNEIVVAAAGSAAPIAAASTSTGRKTRMASSPRGRDIIRVRPSLTRTPMALHRAKRSATRHHRGDRRRQLLHGLLRGDIARGGGIGEPFGRAQHAPQSRLGQHARGCER